MTCEIIQATEKSIFYASVKCMLYTQLTLAAVMLWAPFQTTHSFCNLHIPNPHGEHLASALDVI